MLVIGYYINNKTCMHVLYNSVCLSVIINITSHYIGEEKNVQVFHIISYAVLGTKFIASHFHSVMNDIQTFAQVSTYH